MLSRLKGALQDGKVGSLPHYRAIFIMVFLMAEAATFGIEGYYLAIGENTVGFLFLDTALYTVIAAFLMLLSYFLLGRVLSAYLESQGKFEDLVNNSPDTIYYLDGEGKIAWVNEAGLAFFGYRRLDEVSGRPFIDFIHEEDLEEAIAAFEKRPDERTDTGDGLTFRMVRKGGGVAWVELHSHSMFDGEGKFQQSVGIIRDVTGRKEYQDALERANAELEGYAHTVSHDLKNPIQTVLLACSGIMNVVEEGKMNGSEEIVETLAEGAVAGAFRASHMIEELLLLAESGQIPEAVGPVGISEKVDEVLSEKAQDISERGIEVDVDEDMGEVVAAPAHIYQLFANLVRNSIKYNDSNNPRIEIHHSPPENGEGHRYLVRDNGPGIPMEIMDTVFLPFTKGESGETGIGLSIVEKIVKTYGGDIRAFNEGGACFEFTLNDAVPQ